ncbi:type II secretion system F family protein [Nakamurella sp.]|uniref:type II secretion system F family protein n=1 Tax=Nakamurella sp. TaxID=1869182 RepID=UPI0037840438
MTGGAGAGWPSATTAAVVALVIATALLVVPEIPRVRRPGGSAARPDPGRRHLAPPVLVFLAGALIAPSWWWLALLAAVALGLGRGGWPARGSPRRRAARRRLLIVHAELLASCLDSGMPMAAALRAVGDVLGGRSSPAGSAELLITLESVAAMLALGADADTAWRPADVEEDLVPLAAAARRSATGGTTLADAVREHGRQLREEARQDAARSAGRAGVVMTAPLGVCFLPAFLCLGLAPVVLGLLERLSIF